MSSGFTTRNSFEQVYLREALVTRTLKKLGNKRVTEIMNTGYFKKCVNRVASLHYHKGNKIYTAAGFYKEDLQSMATLYGITFYYYYERGKDSEKDECYLLMRYLNQKFISAYDILKRKFFLKFAEPEELCADFTHIDAAAPEPVTEETPEVRPQIQSRKSYNKQCIEKLEAQPDKYSKALLYYANTTTVPEKIRRKAQKYCKKYGINYNK